MSDLGSFFGSGFDPQSVEPQGDFEVLTPGKYPVFVESAEVKQTKNGDGHYIKLQLSILDGHGKGRKLWDNINIDNPNQKCVEIGLRSLSALGQAIGLNSISDTSQLLNKTCIAHVKVRHDDQYGDKNEIRTYSALTQNPLPEYGRTYSPPTIAQPTEHVIGQKSGKTPWRK